MKQVIVVNEALQLPRGKLAAQVAHASVASFLSAREEAQQAWLENGMPKIVLRCESEDELLRLQERARSAGVAAALIKDAGHTVLAPGTITCLGIGPDTVENVNALTGTLKLVS